MKTHLTQLMTDDTSNQPVTFRPDLTPQKRLDALHAFIEDVLENQFSQIAGDEVIREGDITVANVYYRDEDNYKIPYGLGVHDDGTVWIDEPEWLNDEDDSQDAFWKELVEAFQSIQ